MDKLPETITETMYVAVSTSRYNRGEVCILSFKPLADMDYVILSEEEITLPVPQNVNVTAKQLSVLQAKKENINTKFMVELDLVEREIQELQALPAPKLKSV